MGVDRVVAEEFVDSLDHQELEDAARDDAVEEAAAGGGDDHGLLLERVRGLEFLEGCAGGQGGRRGCRRRDDALGLAVGRGLEGRVAICLRPVDLERLLVDRRGLRRRAQRAAELEPVWWGRQRRGRVDGRR